MKDSKKRIKVAPIETSLLYLILVLLPVIFLVLAMFSSSARADWTPKNHVLQEHAPALQGWTELQADGR